MKLQTNERELKMDDDTSMFITNYLYGEVITHPYLNVCRTADYTKGLRKVTFSFPKETHTYEMILQYDIDQQKWHSSLYKNGSDITPDELYLLYAELNLDNHISLIV